MKKYSPILKSFLIYAFSLLLTYLAEKYLITLPYAPPLANDLSFYFLPYIKFMEYIADGVMLFVLILVAIYLFRYPQDLAFVATCVGFFYIMRAISLVLTPLPYPIAKEGFYGFSFHLSLNGMFPSGHTGASFLAFFYFLKKFGWTLLSKVSFISSFIIVAALLLSRGHYSIDIVGGVLAGYFAYNLAKHPLVKNFIGYKYP